MLVQVQGTGLVLMPTLSLETQAQAWWRLLRTQHHWVTAQGTLPQPLEQQAKGRWCQCQRMEQQGCPTCTHFLQVPTATRSRAQQGSGWETTLLPSLLLQQKQSGVMIQLAGTLRQLVPAERMEEEGASRQQGETRRGWQPSG